MWPGPLPPIVEVEGEFPDGYRDPLFTPQDLEIIASDPPNSLGVYEWPDQTYSLTKTVTDLLS